MKRKIIELILIVIFYVFQTTLGRFISVGGITPDFLIILPIIFGFLNGKNEGIFVGFFAGLMYDLINYDVVGFSALVFMYAGFFAGCYYQKYEESEIMFPIMLVCIGNTGFEFISYIGNFLLHNRLDVLYYMYRIILPETVYTLLVMIIIYKPLTFLNPRFDSKSRRRANSFD